MNHGKILTIPQNPAETMLLKPYSAGMGFCLNPNKKSILRKNTLKQPSIAQKLKEF